MGKSGWNNHDGSGDNSGFALTDKRLDQAVFHEMTVRDRRKFERFPVEGSVYAVVGPFFNQPGHIVNISMSGLAFHYVSTSDEIKLTQSVVQLKDNNRVFCSLPFISVSDTGGDVPDPYSSVEIRYHRGRFGQLTKEQTRNLRTFIKKWTSHNRNS